MPDELENGIAQRAGRESNRIQFLRSSEAEPTELTGGFIALITTKNTKLLSGFLPFTLTLVLTEELFHSNNNLRHLIGPGLQPGIAPFPILNFIIKFKGLFEVGPSHAKDGNEFA